MAGKICAKCGNKHFYGVRRSKFRCKKCGYEFRVWLVKGQRLRKNDWVKLINWFLLERSGLWIGREMKLGKNQAYSVLLRIRQVMGRDVPRIFSGVVEVDETYLGGQKKNKNKRQYYLT